MAHQQPGPPERPPRHIRGTKYIIHSLLDQANSINNLLIYLTGPVKNTLKEEQVEVLHEGLDLFEFITHQARQSLGPRPQNPRPPCPPRPPPPRPPPPYREDDSDDSNENDNGNNAVVRQRPEVVYEVVTIDDDDDNNVPDSPPPPYSQA